MEIPVIQDINLEKTIIASALYSEQAMIDTVHGVTQDCFLDDFHKAVYNELTTCVTKGYDVDVVLIANRISSEMPKVDVHTRLGYLMTEQSTTNNVKPRLRELKSHTDARGIINSVAKVLGSANGITDVSDWVDGTLSTLQGIARTGDEKTELKHLSSFFPRAISRYEAVMRGEEVGVMTGIKDLDEQTNGLRKGEYVILGGRPGAGKTGLAVTMVKNMAKSGHRVGYFSIEVRGDDLVFRICSMLSTDLGCEVPYSAFRGRTPSTSTHLNGFQNALSKMQEMKIFINDSARTSISDIEIELRRFIVREQLDVVVVDHIGIVKDAQTDTRKRHERLQEFSIKLAELWKDLEVVGLVLVQLKRKENNSVPTMDDLSECSQFEKDAHLIYMIHTPDLENVKDKVIVCTKARDTGIGAYPVDFSTNTLEFKSSLPDSYRDEEDHW